MNSRPALMLIVVSAALSFAILMAWQFAVGLGSTGIQGKIDKLEEQGMKLCYMELHWELEKGSTEVKQVFVSKQCAANVIDQYEEQGYNVTSTEEQPVNQYGFESTEYLLEKNSTATK